MYFGGLEVFTILILLDGFEDFSFFIFDPFDFIFMKNIIICLLYSFIKNQKV